MRVTTDRSGGRLRVPTDADPLEEVDLAVLAALARGLTVTEVATEFHLSRRTLTRRMVDVRAVLGVETNVEAVVAVVRSGRI